MNQQDIKKLIQQEIREHEIRVGVISGVIGIAVILGVFHAIWLLR